MWEREAEITLHVAFLMLSLALRKCAAPSTVHELHHELNILLYFN